MNWRKRKKGKKRVVGIWWRERIGEKEKNKVHA
jgi:hypothetical protein